MADSPSLIPVARPWLDAEEVRAVEQTLLSGWVTQGPQVQAFERELAAYVGAPYACAVSSGTTALHLALLAVRVGPGDEVITASHSFIATANSIRYCGATPVFVDIEPETLNLDPALVEKAITPRTRAVLAVHQLGVPCDLAALVEITRRRGLFLIEDAACAIGSEILREGRWERIGRPHGDIACFSFHPRKLVTTGDGGMLTTSNPEWDRQFRLWRQHGMSVPDTDRHASREVVFESYLGVGYNYRMTDIQASIGRVQLRRLPAALERRRALALRYGDHLAVIPSLVPPKDHALARRNWQSYCVRLPEGADQRTVMQALLDRGVATRRGVMCAHREAAYPPGTWKCGGTPTCACRPGTCAELAHSERAQDRTIVLPLFEGMTEAEQDRVVAALAAVCGSRRT